MRETRILMGMPITVEIIDCLYARLLGDIFAYFDAIDRRFSVFRPDSEIIAFNRGRLARTEISAQLREVLALADQTRRRTHGYFDICRPDGLIDPSGIVKGWAIRNAARLIDAAGAKNYFIDAGGDIQSRGKSVDGTDWKIGIRNPFNDREIIKIVHPLGLGVATSGSYARGDHIYNPHQPDHPIADIVSLTVIGADVMQADLYATAGFAMGNGGIYFIEETPQLEGYAIDMNGVATQTTGFGTFVVS
jgi:thiamine biosynthesis lipoprotein